MALRYRDADRTFRRCVANLYDAATLSPPQPNEPPSIRSTAWKGGRDPSSGSRRAKKAPSCPSPATNPWVEIVIQTHLTLSGERGTEPLSRNHIVVLTAHVIVVLPGGHGTASEVKLACAYGRPIVAFVESADDLPGLAVMMCPTTNSWSASRARHQTMPAFSVLPCNR
jgi:hypothetical protein